MSEQQMSYFGYVCAPYLHNHESVKLKDSWVSSRNIEALYFVTGTFSDESKPYFSESSNHYLLGKFKDSQFIVDDLNQHNQEKTSFIFNVKNELFQRQVSGETNFVTVYYLEYGESNDDFQEVADILLKREKISTGGLGYMNTFCKLPAKFTFPYSENVVIIEVASEKGHQSVKKYCDQTKRDVNRKGLTMTNLLSLSILEKLK
ncbi:MAG: hypothetical protein COV65_04175 [Nitrosopumilales archaeon CG11_big_fil_rev_8_21_14_0_20_33_24]|nr:MAG: hypothetical protein COV65_04175 [Nitrosopumilales archaeon CG11_big_fil_rev_8_21_14_0_20_33_24]PIY89421.1 MAG: hypothetical protein COY74_06050 [Nitrosopumilales archaeon CG_4_10_14_0_8_um_filter_34_8]PJB97681.1 MAG: hypothetical protein CO079_06080 [Nitrosopumilales archaeon CG_4_9_14_0_8_um_filter_34_10]